MTANCFLIYKEGEKRGRYSTKITLVFTNYLVIANTKSNVSFHELSTLFHNLDRS